MDERIRQHRTPMPQREDPLAAKRRMVDTDSEEWQQMAKKYKELPMSVQEEILIEVEKQKRLKPMTPMETNELFKSKIVQKYKEIIEEYDSLEAKDSDRFFSPKISADTQELEDQNTAGVLSTEASIESAENIINQDDLHPKDGDKFTH